MVECRIHECDILVPDGLHGMQEGEQAGMRRREVVQAGCTEQLGISPDERGRGYVVEDKVMSGHVTSADLGLVGEKLNEIPGANVPQAPDRQQVLLRIKLETVIVDLPVEMGSELRDAAAAAG